MATQEGRSDRGPRRSKTMAPGPAGQLGTMVSSLRYKRDIQPMGAHSHKLLQLRPVIFRYIQDAQGTRQYGLIAEEVAKVYPELVTRKAQNARLQATVGQLQEQNAAMAARLERLEAAAARAATLASR